MTMFSRVCLGLNAVFAGLVTGHMALAEPASRVVSVGGSITEIVYALGQQHRLAGRDRTSTHPAEAAELPDIGYARALSAEGLLSVDPDLIIAIEGAGPPETLEVVQDARVAYVSVPEDFTAAGIATKIRAVGTALGQERAAEALAETVTSEVAAAQSAAVQTAGANPKRVLFVLSAQSGRIMAGGRGTAADGIIRMAGAVNAMPRFEGYKPVTDEAIATAAPDVILMMERTGSHGTSTQDLLALPAIAPTPAAQTGSVVRMNGLHLLGFGPRTAAAVRDLNQAFYGMGGAHVSGN